MVSYTEEIKKMNLWEKIANISNEIDYLQKDDTVGFGKSSYKAISSEKVIGVCAEKMSKYGIVIYPCEQQYKRTDEQVTDSEGKTKYNRISDVDTKYLVVNIHNPQETLTTVASGTGVDTQDKGIGKAQTYAYKNMLVKLFAIPVGDDTDKIHSDDYSEKLYGQGKAPSEGPSSDTSYLSDAQIKRLYAIAYHKGYSREDVDKAVKKKFNVEVKRLNKLQYETVCNGYSSLEDKEVVNR